MGRRHWANFGGGPRSIREQRTYGPYLLLLSGVVYSYWGYTMSDSFDGLGRKRKTHCKYGHQFAEDARWQTNWRGYQCRVCRECARLRAERKRLKPGRRDYEAAKMRKWRAENKERSNAAHRRAYTKRNEWVQGHKVKCLHCPESRFPCLDFHHRESDKKVGTIAQVRHWSRERLAEEIAKCDVLCANCHRWHHWVEKQRQRPEKDVVQS